MTNIYLTGLPHNKISLANGLDSQSSVKLEYLAEGNANVVYCFKPFGEKDEFPSALKNKLLRLRKDKSFIQSTRSQFATYQQHFVPLFDRMNLVEHALVALDPDVISTLNKDLERLEKECLRGKLRHGDTLALDEDYGLLMTDMTAQSGECHFEIKPKWLLQSPDAPQGSLRCRTCALRAQRNAAKARGATIPSSGGFCPLSLVDADFNERRDSFENIVRSQATYIPQHIVQRIVHFLTEEGHRVLQDLCKHQARFDATGLLNSNVEAIHDDYLKAMTLRDCVLFVKGSVENFANTAEVRLADLDFKHAHPDKVAKWKGTERKLIDEGWYTHQGAQNGLESTCLLARRACRDM